MNINIKGTNIELTESIRQYVYDKLEMLRKVLRDPEAAYIHVEVGKESQHHMKGEIFFAEVDLRDSGRSFYAKIENEDLYAAIDLVKDQVLEEMKSQKDKQHSLLRRGGIKIKDFIRGFWNNK